MSAAHTPGPWVASRDTYRDRAHRRDAVAAWVERREADDLWIVEAGDGSSVLVGGEANARLIAAAPDLLAACEAALRAFEDMEDRAPIEECRQLRAAIARTRGAK